jgi:TRAP-type C4-dicarboxylate transport system permease small subunit
MPKALCIFGMVIALLLAVIFLADLFVRMAGGAITPAMNTIMDVVFILCAVMLGYVSWSTWREQT